MANIDWKRARYFFFESAARIMTIVAVVRRGNKKTVRWRHSPPNLWRFCTWGASHPGGASQVAQATPLEADIPRGAVAFSVVVGHPITSLERTIHSAKSVGHCVASLITLL